MVTPFIPLRHEVIRVRRLQETGVDGLGNDIIVDVEDEVPVKVAGWASARSDEPKVAGHDRLAVDVELFALPGDFTEGDAVRLDPYGLLEVVGHPEDYNHGPWWSPGLVVVNLRRADR